MNRNCWTCTHDLPPPRGTRGHACAQLDQDAPPADPLQWVEKTWLHPSSQMPRKNADGCPGWAAKETT